MLYSFLLLAYAFLLSHLLGVRAHILLQKIFRFEPKNDTEFGLSNILGLAVMSPFIAICHFFFKIDFTLHLFFIAIVCINPKQTIFELNILWTHLKNNYLFFIIVLLAALLSIIARPGIGDIADYHLQAIKWAENYPNIIGLGNFNRPLANNNWWFNLQAFFGQGWFGIRSVYVCNALLFISALQIFILNKPANAVQLMVRFVFALFSALSVKTAFVGSVTPDIVVTTIIFIVVDLYLSCIYNKSQQKQYLLIMMLLIAWILTVKATAITLFLIPLPLLFRNYFNIKEWRGFAGITILVLIFFIPWLIGNVIACGYLLYPFNQIDLFDVDWKVPASYFEFDKLVISSWGKVSEQDIYITKAMTVSQWMPLWFGKLDLFNKGLIVVYLISIPVMLFQSIKQKQYLWPFLFLQLGFALIFFNGPHVRFLFPYMVSTFALLLGTFSGIFKFRLPQNALLGLIVLLSFLLMFKLYKKGELFSSFVEPKPYPVALLNEVKINGFTAYITQNNNSCWDRFPCSYYFIDSVQLRGAYVRSGFKVRQ
ncbi:MAG: hypothetical protein Q8M15_03535 [Bacteroidota bacterium]|nr:hypothetical protein [Bacteroidota bacterium]